MVRLIKHLTAAITFVLLTGCSENSKTEPGHKTTLFLEDIAGYSFPITTKSPEAQKFFNEGMIFAYGFNHEEAIRSFNAAAKHDPNAAMVYWGKAYVLGPNINIPMDPKNGPLAWELINKAAQLSGNATQKEKDLIQALKSRYSNAVATDRTNLDKQWEEETAVLIEKYPDDPDVATLRAESLMLLRPWNYWTKEKNPYPETEETIVTLERAMDNDPDHVGLLHFYIHIMEASKSPKKAEAAADKLRHLDIKSGHLQHMPAHIYMRVGRYDDAIESNKSAVSSDESHLKHLGIKGEYHYLYYPHNTHFLVWAYMIQGRKQEALDGAQKIVQNAKPDEIQTKTFLNSFAVVPYFVMLRFGMWDEILQLPEPPKNQPYVRANWYYVRGVALARKHAIDEAEAALIELKNIANDPSFQTLVLLSYNKAEPILNIAIHELTAEIQLAKGNVQEAIVNLQKGVQLEDELGYNEPPDWMIPMRETLGFAYLSSKQPKKAETAFRENLERHPNNGWSLKGLYQSLLAQGNNNEAEAVKKQLNKAWSKADK